MSYRVEFEGDTIRLHGTDGILLAQAALSAVPGEGWAVMAYTGPGSNDYTLSRGIRSRFDALDAMEAHAESLGEVLA